MTTRNSLYRPLRWGLWMVFPFLAACGADPKTEEEAPEIRVAWQEDGPATNFLDLTFDSVQTEMIRAGLGELVGYYRDIRAYPLADTIPPALVFNPLSCLSEQVSPPSGPPVEWTFPSDVRLPGSEADLAFLSIPELSGLIHSGEISCLALTQFFLERLKAFDPQLHCVITLTEEYALERARALDVELARGMDRGILHGIPYGAKDLFAFPGYPTTWGAAPYRSQILDQKATVLEKLEEAGAVLLAKTSLGALAMGDVWFADTTRNPWNLEEGSSGSSAGSAAAVSAGLLPFALGSETWGSIVSPSTRCGVTGLRPGFGRVSRAGAMALSWSMDKVGPICRSAEDCAIVFAHIQGPDPRDPSVVDAGFSYTGRADLSSLRIGYYQKAFEAEYDSRKQDQHSLRVLRRLGAELIPVDLGNGGIPVDALSIILNAEAAAAFDELTRSRRDSLMVRQHQYAWPNLFRTARYIPAVEYIQANRIRVDLIRDLHERMKDFDVIVCPTFEGGNQLLPPTSAAIRPWWFPMDSGTRLPTSLCFLGNYFSEGTLLAVAAAYQEATDTEDRRPPLFDRNP
ncbi:MAG: amidase [Bacteroidales bacterium]